MAPKSIKTRLFDQSEASGLQLLVPGVLRRGYPSKMDPTIVEKITKTNENRRPNAEHLVGYPKKRPTEIDAQPLSYTDTSAQRC